MFIFSFTVVMHFIPLVCVMSKPHVLLFLAPSTGLGTQYDHSNPLEGISGCRVICFRAEVPQMLS